MLVLGKEKNEKAEWTRQEKMGPASAVRKTLSCAATEYTEATETALNTAVHNGKQLCV